MTASSTEQTFTDLEWSSTGMTELNGCYLATLTSRGEVLIYKPLGNPESTKWKMWCNVSELVAKDLGLLGREEITEHDVKEARIHSIAWIQRPSRNLNEQGQKVSLLLMGTENGNVLVYECCRTLENEIKITFVQKIGVFIGKQNWVVGLKIIGSPQSGESIMAAALGHENDIHVFSLQDNDKEQEPSFQVSDMILVKPKSRYTVSTMSWFLASANNKTITKDGKLLLAAASCGFLDIIIVQKKEVMHRSRLKIPFITACCGILMYPKSDQDVISSVKLTVLSCSGQVYSYGFNLNTLTDFDSVKSLATENLNNIFNNQKRKIDAEFSKVDIRSYGCVTHPSGGYCALVYSLSPGNMLRYPIASQRSLRIAFASLEKTPEFCRCQSRQQGSSLSLWWKFSHYTRSVPRLRRQEFIDNFAKSLTLTAPKITLSSNLHKDLWSNMYNEAMDEIRLRYHVDDSFTKANDIILRQLCETVLQHLTTYGKDSDITNDIDRAVVLSYGYFCGNIPFLNIVPGSSFISISGGFFEEKFDFANQLDLSTILTSCDDHVWQRCSVSLLPILTTDSLCCIGCDRSIINWKGLDKNSLTAKILSTLDVCIYCGCHYYQRKVE